jgi:hypothetical protein
LTKEAHGSPSSCIVDALPNKTPVYGVKLTYDVP